MKVNVGNKFETKRRRDICWQVKTDGLREAAAAAGDIQGDIDGNGRIQAHRG